MSELTHLTFYRYLSVSWGTTLLILGLSSIIFQEAPIIIVFVVSLAWAGIYNMLFGGVWIFFGLLFIFSSLRLFWKIRFFQKFEKEYNSFIVQQDSPLETRVQRAPRYFPRLGYLVSSFASAALIGLYIVTALDAISQKFMLGWIFDFINRAGMIGFSVSLAALLSKMRPKWMAWVGIVLGALVMFNELASRLL